MLFFDDGFTPSEHSLMKEIPGIQAGAKIALVGLMPPNITMRFRSRLDSGKVGRMTQQSCLCLQEVPQYPLGPAQALRLALYSDGC